jgi:hypothetical protein
MFSIVREIKINVIKYYEERTNLKGIYLNKTTLIFRLLLTAT